jgi:hypothetical protein
MRRGVAWDSVLEFLKGRMRDVVEACGEEKGETRYIKKQRSKAEKVIYLISIPALILLCYAHRVIRWLLVSYQER